MTSSSTRERKLTPPEIADRTPVLLALLDDQDSIRLRVRASRDELREWRVEARNLAIQIDQVRQEIRSGIVTENAQQVLPFAEPVDSRVQAFATDEGMETEDECSARTVREEMGIDGSSDEPDPETDPPPPREPNRGVEVYRMFDMNYPAPKDHAALHDMLMDVLTDAELSKLSWADVKTWHKSSGEFEAVAHWARVENGHTVIGKRTPTPGMTVPARFPMPGVLQQALAASVPTKKAKATRKKKTARAT